MNKSLAFCFYLVQYSHINNVNASMKFNLKSEMEMARNSLHGRTNKKALLAKLQNGMDANNAFLIISNMYNSAVKEIVYKESGNE